MASVNDTVRESILQFPSLLRNRTEVLHYLLCVNGNNHEWFDGEVINLDPEEHWTPEQDILEHERTSKTEAIREIYRPILDKTIAENTVIVRDVDVLMHTDADVESFYPQCDYANLMNIPDDIKPDWAEACEEMKILAEANGWVFSK